MDFLFQESTSFEHVVFWVGVIGFIAYMSFLFLASIEDWLRRKID